MISVLIIKTSSLGDIIHTLPALTDAKIALGDICFDWLVEENFAEIPAFHPAVRTVIPVAIRRWRKNIIRTVFNGEFSTFKKQLQRQHYDVVIDAQGLLKSAWLSRLTKGECYGLDKKSAREPLAALFYQHPVSIAKNQHAVERVRQLFAQSLGYTLSDAGIPLALNYNITHVRKNTQRNSQQEILFLHGTTWQSKHWPDQYWLELADLVTEQGHNILLPWSNDAEYKRAKKIQKQCKNKQAVTVLAKMNLTQLLEKISMVSAVVAVDTGLAHLSAALNKPTIALYGPTSPGLTGTYGKNQIHLRSGMDCAPCFKKYCPHVQGNKNPLCYNDINPNYVMLSLMAQLKTLMQYDTES